MSGFRKGIPASACLGQPIFPLSEIRHNLLIVMVSKNTSLTRESLDYAKSGPVVSSPGLSESGNDA
jgi:hypothetical protein